MDQSSRKLTPRQALFVSEYLKDSNGSRAAIAAGYSPLAAKQRAYELLHNSPEVVAEVDAARSELARAGVYNLKHAMDEADAAIRFAKETKNGNAFVKAVELKAKLSGLLIDRKDVRTLSGFKINIAGVDE